MFDKGYVFKGRHAEYVNDLTKNYDDDGHKLFNRNYDVYLLAPVIGFLYQRKAEPDQNGDFRTSILPDILMKNSDDLMFNFRLVMILDKKAEPDPEKRIDKAFKGENDDADSELYDSYVLGGVEVLYEKLMQNVNTSEEYTSRLFDFIEEFDQRYNQKVDMNSLLDLCRQIKA